MNTDLLDMEAIAGSETNRKYITEDEFKKINKTFKIHLNHKAKEIEDLGNLVFHSKGKHELKVKQNDKLQEDVEKKRKLLSEIELELEDSYKRLLLLEKKVYVEDVISIDFINETSSFSQGDLRQVPIIKNKLIKLLDHYKNLESQSFTLQIEKNWLNKKLRDAEDVSNREQQCRNCFSKFTATCNNDLSCVYHTGKLKFFSCRGCGQDEYMTCCMKCLDCLSGCRTSHHLGY